MVKALVWTALTHCQAFKGVQKHWSNHVFPSIHDAIGPSLAKPSMAFVPWQVRGPSERYHSD